MKSSNQAVAIKATKVVESGTKGGNLAYENLSLAERQELFARLSGDKQLGEVRDKERLGLESELHEIMVKIKVKKDSLATYTKKIRVEIEEMQQEYQSISSDYSEAGFAIKIPKRENHTGAGKKAKYENFEEVEILMGCSGNRLLRISCKNGVFLAKNQAGDRMESTQLSNIEKEFGDNRHTDHIKIPLAALGIIEIAKIQAPTDK